ncbi:serine/threonine-protein kinase [Phytohabitans kaempferiae]|uniref:non-specific serine/threonine protein kinase n=1 Tax=Phytohabitans kaempferiae TaxID=1620943 RepID=A0ABV6M1C8_9ACTN
MASSGHVVGGRYRLDSVLGAGGMGVVWRAFDERLARWVAVKEIRFTQPMTPEEREEVKYRAMVEALSAGRLVHPNVVAIYDAVDDADQPWVVMRLVEGRSLRELVAQEGPLDAATAARLGLGLLDALDAAHAAGVVHRDVKPSNVLIANGRPLLTDFSIATVAGAQVPLRGTAVMGSPGYVAPERLHGEEGGVPADLFGLGATLFYAVEGVGPFAREDAMACLIATVCDPHPRPVRGSALAAVIDGLLAKDVADRMDSAAARAALLAAARPRSTRTVYRVPLTSRRAYTGHRSVAVLPGPAVASLPEASAPDTRRSRPPRRRRRVTILTAGAALLVPVVATLASTGGPASTGLAGRADAAVRPAPPGQDASADPYGDARALGVPGVLLSPSSDGQLPPYASIPPIGGGMVTQPVSGTSQPGSPITGPGNGLPTEPSGGGGGNTGGTTPPPAPPAVTGLTVSVSVDPTACTYSATAFATVSAPTTVTYRVTWTDGTNSGVSTEFTAAGSGTLTVPSGVPHGAGPVWVQVDVVSPTALSQRGGAELPARCSPTTPPSVPDPSPMTSPSSPNPAPVDGADPTPSGADLPVTTNP